MKNRLEYIAFITFALFFQSLGLRLSRKFAVVLAFFFFYFLPIRKKTVLKNLKLVFTDFDEKKIKQIAFDNYKSFMIFFIELLCLPKLSQSEIEKLITTDEIKILAEKRKDEKGVILLTAHFGNWELAALAASYYLNLRFNVIAKPLRNTFVDNWLNKLRTSGMNEVINLKSSVRKSLEVLKKNEVLAILGDQRGPQEGIKINFFERETSVYTGPAAFSLKTGAPIIFMIIVRQPDYKYKILAHEISLADLPKDENEKIIELTKRHLSFLENYIRKYPDQWLWMHNRWRH